MNWVQARPYQARTWSNLPLTWLHLMPDCRANWKVFERNFSTDPPRSEFARQFAYVLIRFRRARGWIWGVLILWPRYKSKNMFDNFWTKPLYTQQRPNARVRPGGRIDSQVEGRRSLGNSLRRSRILSDMGHHSYYPTNRLLSEVYRTRAEI